MTSRPAEHTVERWAWDYLAADDLEARLSLAPPPRAWECGPPRPSVRPARPAPLSPALRAFKTPSAAALRASPEKRAQLVHTFLHHELQAAELMCWAVLAFPDAPEAFRAGLAGVARDEARHVGMYREHLRALGHDFGDFPVRDWFWERVPASETPAHFVATMGVGFEGANLDHTARFAARFREAGDEAGAALQDRVAEEELPHVRFALHWFRRFTGRDDFASWSAHLTPPLTPTVMRGAPVERGPRARAGMSEAFIEELCAWRGTVPGS